MARILSVTTSSGQTNTLLQDLKKVEGLLELQVFTGASVKPPGDVVKFSVPNSSLHEVMRMLDGYKLGQENGLSLSSSEPASYIPAGSSYPLERDINEGSWEEMEMTISNDSNTSINTLLIMIVSGSLATIGVAMNSLHIVIGGMLVAPGFMPITRVALGLVSRHKAWYYGSRDFLKGYLTLFLGATLTALLLKAMGYNLLPGSSSYYVPDQKLIYYWSTITMPSLLASAVASIAGALLVSTRKSVFTSGVMIGLALVPTMAIVGMGIIEGNYELAGRAFIRFALDVGLVLIFSFAVFLWVRLYYHKRDTHL